MRAQQADGALVALADSRLTHAELAGDGLLGVPGGYEAHHAALALRQLLDGATEPLDALLELGLVLRALASAGQLVLEAPPLKLAGVVSVQDAHLARAQHLPLQPGVSAQLVPNAVASEHGQVPEGAGVARLGAL